MTTLAMVILAAGQGTRMKSRLAKVLHPVGGRPMVEYAIDTAWELTGRAPVLVVGVQGDQVRAHAGERAVCVEQQAQLGTAHAARMAADALRDQADLVLVCYADMPLLRPETLRRLVEPLRVERRQRPAMSLLTYVSDNPRGFGRILRRSDGLVEAIVEEAAATPEQLRLRELNVGVYVFDAAWLWDALARITPTPPKNEFYLTDTVALANADGRAVVAITGDDPDELIGINTRVHLAEAEAALRRRVNRAHMLNGVTLIDPASTYIEPTVTIGPDTVIGPNTHLRGKTQIGAACEIGPNCIIADAVIADECRVVASVIEGAVLERQVCVGPFARVRRGARLCAGVHMGNFGEVKNSTLGPGVKMGHFSYVGDAEVGAGVNISAGVITCNFDGVNKHRTIIGENAFIGSDTMLIAPVEIGAEAQTGAGAVVRQDVPPGKLAVGVPARIIGERRKPKKPES